MPLEIKYKEPIKNPVKEVTWKDKTGDAISVSYVGKYLRFNCDAEVDFTPAEFKEFAAAIYKFSQEI